MPDTFPRRFTDRRAAGRALAARLSSFAGPDTVVLGLARGGVPVAHEVARALGAPLDVFVVRKIGAPWNPEFGIGAIAEGGVRVLNPMAVYELRVGAAELDVAIERATAEIAARLQRYRRGAAPIDVRGRTVIVVDDGLATGGTARAALRAIRARHPRTLILAVPVAAAESVESLRDEADDVVCVLEPESMRAVGLWYEHFEPTADAEIAELLADNTVALPPLRTGSCEVHIPVGGGSVEIVGDLALAPSAAGLVVFAHGSGSSRHSHRNRQVARALNDRRFATLLLDLLTPGEERDRANVFDLDLLADRLVAATRWAQQDRRIAGLRIGYFGASTGAGAALTAAAELGEEVAAVVSRGGRPDLAGARLAQVRAPVLLIVGGLDGVVVDLNRQARRLLQSPTQLSIIPGATHLFEEPGALEEVARLAGDWFVRHLNPADEPR